MTDYPKTTKFSPPDNLTVFESAVVQAIVSELNLPVPMEMENMRVFERQLSGAGLFVEFAIYDTKSNVDEQFVSDIYAEVLGADQGVGFVLCAKE